MPATGLEQCDARNPRESRPEVRHSAQAGQLVDSDRKLSRRSPEVWLRFDSGQLDLLRNRGAVQEVDDGSIQASARRRSRRR